MWQHLAFVVWSSAALSSLYDAGQFAGLTSMVSPGTVEKVSAQLASLGVENADEGFLANFSISVRKALAGRGRASGDSPVTRELASRELAPLLGSTRRIFTQALDAPDEHDVAAVGSR